MSSSFDCRVPTAAIEASFEWLLLWYAPQIRLKVLYSSLCIGARCGLWVLGLCNTSEALVKMGLIMPVAVNCVLPLRGSSVVVLGALCLQPHHAWFAVGGGSVGDL